MLDEIRAAAQRRTQAQRQLRAVRDAIKASKQLLSGSGELNGMSAARDLVQLLGALQGDALNGFFDYLAQDLSPDPGSVLRSARRYAEQPDAAALIDLTRVVEPPRQELFRRLNRAPGGTAAILHLRRGLLERLADQPALSVIEADLLHLLGSWFNPGFLKMRRVDWQSPAGLLEKIIQHEAVHAIDGWDDLRRRLQPDRRCFAFFHPQLPDEPLIFVEVALVPEMPAAIAPLIHKQSEPLPPSQFKVACFYSISNCERGLRGVSLGNFLIKSVAEQLQRELPRIKTFCTLSPMPLFARWLKALGSAIEVPGLKRGGPQALVAARDQLLAAVDGDWARLAQAGTQQTLPAPAQDALRALGAAYLLHASHTPQGDPVARFHLDNGARLQRINAQGNLSARGLDQAFGLMVNYLYDLPKIEESHARFRAGEVTRSREVAALL